MFSGRAFVRFGHHGMARYLIASQRKLDILKVLFCSLGQVTKHQSFGGSVLIRDQIAPFRLKTKQLPVTLSMLEFSFRNITIAARQWRNCYRLLHMQFSWVVLLIPQELTA